MYWIGYEIEEVRREYTKDEEERSEKKTNTNRVRKRMYQYAGCSVTLSTSHPSARSALLSALVKLWTLNTRGGGRNVRRWGYL